MSFVSSAHDMSGGVGKERGRVIAGKHRCESHQHPPHTRLMSAVSRFGGRHPLDRMDSGEAGSPRMHPLLEAQLPPEAQAQLAAASRLRAQKLLVSCPLLSREYRYMQFANLAAF